MQISSLIQGKRILGKISNKNISPIDGSEISQSNFLVEQDLIEVFQKAKQTNHKEKKIDYLELIKLSEFFKQNHLKFTEQIIKDSGFIREDAEDLVNCSIEFCEYYSQHLKELFKGDVVTTFTYLNNSKQKIRLTSSPYGLIAATTPRNTPLITELTIIVHALWSGNSLVLRPSPGVAGTVNLLIQGLIKCFTKETLAKLNIVFADAKEFVSASLDHSNLLHYVGSTKYLENTLIAGIKKGVKVLLDGDGCSMVIVDSTANIEEAVMACYKGLIRCNGQICISVRVILVEQSIYQEFSSKFLNFVKNTKVGKPGSKKGVSMGPLFSSFQTERIKEVTQKYKTLYIKSDLPEGSNYISPVVVELSPSDNNFLKESLFGPIVGIASFKGDGWKKWLEENKINLTDALFSKDKKFIKEFLSVSKSPRRVINTDPTIESVFEPWGAFLPSGWNDVSYWYYKYQNYYQLVRGKK
ncbi:aldehyde dehydrogenase family protein [Candidatus Roizmanbacteria bacterium]|nr:aldehyde dehydrogenase family protein [Candidatus Roizmanbacteria bacterium]